MSISTEVCFIVESQEYRIKGSKLINTSKYFLELLENSHDFSEIRLILPDWVSSKSFQIYTSYIEKGRVPKIDLIISQKLLWLADFFKDISLQTELITQQIIPFLSRETVLLFVQDSWTKLNSSNEICEAWAELYSSSCEYSAKNLQYLFEKFETVMAKIDENAILNIIEKAVKYEDKNFIFEKLLKLKHKSDIVSLIPTLEYEKTHEFSKNIHSNLVLDWKIDGFEFGNFYKESEPFCVGETSWILCIWCFEHERTLEISIKQSENITENQSKLYNIIAAVQVQDEIVEIQPPQLITVAAYSQNQSILKKMVEFNSESVSEFNIKFYASPISIVSTLLMHIADNPKTMLDWDVSVLPKSYFLTLADFKFLNVESEDVVLEIIAKWIEGKNEGISEAEEQALGEAVRWDYLTVQGIVSVLCAYQKIKNCKNLCGSLKKEMETKLKKPSKAAGSRKSYKKKITREFFNNPKDCLNTVFDALLIPKKQDNSVVEHEKAVINELKEQLASAEKEIAMLKKLSNEVLSPIPQIKVHEEENTINFTPVNKVGNNRSKTSSVDFGVNKSFEVTSRMKTRKAEVIIGDLVSKLRTTKNLRSPFYSSKK